MTLVGLVIAVDYTAWLVGASSLASRFGYLALLGRRPPVYEAALLVPPVVC